MTLKTNTLFHSLEVSICGHSGSGRHRQGHSCGRAKATVRSVFHHKGARERHGPGPGNRDFKSCDTKELRKQRIHYKEDKKLRK